jgi:hypothetical protein
LSVSLPKANEKRYRSIKGKVRQSERPYTLKLIDERALGNRQPGTPDFWESVKVSKPTPTLGWCLPNNFEATIDGVCANFRVELVKKARREQWAITSLVITPQKKGSAIEALNLPLPTFLTEAINLSTLQCVTYPPGFEGESEWHKLVGWKGTTLKTGEKEYFVEVIGWRDSTPAEILRNFTNTSKGRKQDSPERLKIVAKAHNGASYGEKFQKVKEALIASEGGIGDETVKRLIKKAISEGLIKQDTRSKK